LGVLDRARAPECRPHIPHSVPDALLKLLAASGQFLAGIRHLLVQWPAALLASGDEFPLEEPQFGGHPSHAFGRQIGQPQSGIVQFPVKREVLDHRRFD
jgi:hypothetical protein